MERMLLKMAHQLNAYDEASLSSFWEQYAERVERFEPSARWEEAALIFCLIQAVRWKNQLFNLRLTQTARPGPRSSEPPLGFDRVNSFLRREAEESSPVAAGGRSGPRSGKKRCKILRFSRRKGDKPV